MIEFPSDPLWQRQSDKPEECIENFKEALRNASAQDLDRLARLMKENSARIPKGVSLGRIRAAVEQQATLVRSGKADFSKTLEALQRGDHVGQWSSPYMEARRDPVFVEARQSLSDWFAAKSFTLQRPATSWLHYYWEYLHEANARCGIGAPPSVPPMSILIEHNWAAAFAGDREFEARNDIRLSAPMVGFEFQISGRRVIALADDVYGAENFWVAISLPQSKSNWFEHGNTRDDELAKKTDGLDHWQLQQHRGAFNELTALLSRNIKGASIAIEAEVAELVVERAPYKLNRARERRGKPPLFDFHRIVLSKRRRLAPVPAELFASDEPRHSPRWHFRRGHYRHFATFKTWIKWTLVGEPDLGFIDKEYRL